MSKNKYNFAYELLSSSRVTPEQKKRILALIAQERNEDIVLLENRIGNLEKKEEAEETIIEEESKSEQKKEIENKTIYYTDIDILPKFLKNLNEGNFTNLLTHKIDNSDYLSLIQKLGGEYTYTKHLEKIKQEFKEKTGEFVSTYMYEKANVFINGGVDKEGKVKEWSEDKYQMNWSHPDLLKWVEKHPNIPPSPDDDLKSKLRQEGFSFKFRENIMYFSDLVMRFKDETRIRQGNSIRDIIENLNWDYNFNIKYTAKDTENKSINIDTIDFFTDVEKLRQIFNLCLSWIREHNKNKNKNEIEVCVISNINNIEIDILHLNSYFSKEKSSLKFGKTSKNLMRLANGICDVNIIANFPNNEYYLWPIWENYRMIDKNGTVRFNYKEKKEIIPSETLKENVEKTQQAVIYKLKISRGL